MLQPYKVYNRNADERQIPTLLTGSSQLLANANFQRYLSSASFFAATGKSSGLNFKIVSPSFRRWAIDVIRWTSCWNLRPIDDALTLQRKSIFYECIFTILGFPSKGLSKTDFFGKRRQKNRTSLFHPMFVLLMHTGLQFQLEHQGWSSKSEIIWELRDLHAWEFFTAILAQLARIILREREGMSAGTIRMPTENSLFDLFNALNPSNE